VRAPAEIAQQRGLKAGAAAGVERPCGGPRRAADGVAQDRVQDVVQMLVPRLEIVVDRKSVV